MAIRKEPEPHACGPAHLVFELDLFVLLEVPARDHGAVETAVLLLRTVLVFDLGEVQADLIRRSHVGATGSSRLERRDQQIRHLDFQEFLLFRARLAAGQCGVRDVLALSTSQQTKPAKPC